MNEKTNNNRIPRNFNKITAKILIDTSANKSGEVFYIYPKNGNGGYTGFNTATGLSYHIFPAMLRNKAITEIIEII